MKSLHLCHLLLMMTSSAFTQTMPDGPPPPPVFDTILYSGDLSVLIKTRPGIQYDQCEQLFILPCIIIVMNRGGNVDFTFNVTFQQDGNEILYFDKLHPEGKGYLTVENLKAGKRKKYSVFFKCQEVRNSEIEKSRITAVIQEARCEITAPFCYKIALDKILKNNIAIKTFNLPYVHFTPSPFDQMPVVSVTDDLYYILGNKLQIDSESPGSWLNCEFVAYDPTDVPWGLFDNCYYGTRESTDDTIALFWRYSREIEITRAGCFSSGNPYYHMKIDGKYITYYNGALMLKDAQPDLQEWQKWIFVNNQIEPGGIFIYSKALGTQSRLRVVHRHNECNYNMIILAQPTGGSTDLECNENFENSLYFQRFSISKDFPPR